jgi:hypothetical protein
VEPHSEKKKKNTKQKRKKKQKNKKKTTKQKPSFKKSCKVSQYDEFSFFTLKFAYFCEENYYQTISQLHTLNQVS